MMNILLKNQIKMIINTIRTQRWQNIFGFAVGIAIIGYFAFWLGRLIYSVSNEIPLHIFEGLISYAFLAIIGVTILMGISQVFKSLYSGSDLDMLFAMPISTRKIFWVKYILSYLGTPLIVFLAFSVPLVVYGVAIGAPLLYFVMAILTLFVITVISLSLIYLLNLLLIQVMPPNRANEFVTVMSLLSGLVVYFIFVFPMTMSDVPIIDRILSGLPLLPKWVPVTWGSDAVRKAAEGSFSAFLPLGMLLLLTVVLMLLTTTLVEKGFRTGWIRLSERSSKKRKPRKGKQRTSLMKLNHPIIAIGKKEWYTVKRDLREWFTLMPIIFFFVFGVAGFIAGGGGLEDIRGHSNISWPVAQAIFLLLFAFTNNLVTSASVGREGPNLWIVQVLPITGRQLAYGKFWISWVIPFLVIFIIEIIATFVLGWTIWQLVVGVAIKAVISAGMSAIGLWIGTLGAKYNPTNPQQRLTFAATLISFITSYVYVAIALIPVGYLLIPEMALEEIPADLQHGMTGFIGILATIALTALSLKISHPIIMTIVGIIVLLILSIGIAYIFLTISARRFDRGIKIDMVSETSSRGLRRPWGRRSKNL